MAARSRKNSSRASEAIVPRTPGAAGPQPSAAGQQPDRSGGIFSLRWLLAAAALAVLTIAVYAPVRTFPFVDWDDPVYILEAKFVRDGVSAVGIARAFSLQGHAANWHPLTTISHMLDVSLFGLNAGAHHMVNLLIHLLNVLLLFALLTVMLRRTSAPPGGRLALGIIVAALFAIHPMHVESVAWVAERKDVLSGFFFLATLLAYCWYAQRPGAARYGLLAGLFALGLMAKPMLVTLPFVLLLLDWWPLGRISEGAQDCASQAAGAQRPVSSLLLEKVPLLAMAVGSSLLTMTVQRRWGALVEGQNAESTLRTLNAAVSYMVYLGKFFWPSGLAAFYPLDAQQATVANAALSVVFLAAVSAVAILYRRRAAYFAVGWFWFVGMLVPVIGLVRVGDQALADRYTYLPYIGLSLVVALGIAELLSRYRLERLGLPALGSAMILLLALAARAQVNTWRSDRALWEHAAAATRGNYIADVKLGNMDLAEGRREQAITHYQQALRARPVSSDAHLGMGAALADSGRWSEAIPHYEEVLRLKPDSASAHNNLGNAYSALGKYAEADAQFTEAVRLDPGFADGYANHAIALMQQERDREAEAEVRKALALDAKNANYHFLLAAAVQRNGDDAGAMKELEAALRLDPAHAGARKAYQDLGGDPSRIAGLQR